MSLFAEDGGKIGDLSIYGNQLIATPRIDVLAASGKVCVTGYCYGGTMSWLAASRIDGLAAALLRVVRDGDVVVTMGAGSIGAVPAQLTGGGG